MSVPGRPDPVDGGDMTARRYSGELTEALRQEVRAVLVQASARDRNPVQWGRPGGAVALLVAIAIGGAWAMNGRDDPRAVQASVAFSSLNDVRGGRVRAEELLPIREEGAGRAGGAETPGREAKGQDGPKAKMISPTPVHRSGKAPPEVTRQPARVRCTNCGKEGSEEWETVFDASRDEPLLIPAAELPPRSVVNVGTRIAVTLLEPVVTGAGGAPARARVEEDVGTGPRVAVPKGAVLVGQAFATETNDRVQILFGWLVTGGKSHSLRALVLGPDNGLGLKGRVVQRTSRGRGLGGNVLGTVGRVLSFGLLTPGGSDLSSLAARDAAETVGESLRSTGQRWLVSDKVIQLPAGTSAVAYLEGDLELE